MLEEDIFEKSYNSAADCPISMIINVIGGKWKPVIIWLLLQQPKRFGELHRSIPGVALKVLSRNLKELEADGIINRRVYAQVPPKVEYSLTQKGQSLKPMMELMADWCRENLMHAPDGVII